MLSALDKISHNLFVKLLAIFLLTGLALIILLTSSIHFLNSDIDSPFNTLQRNFALYSNYLIDDIGNPPQQEKIQKISDNSGLKIIIQGSDAQWLSDNADPDILHGLGFHGFKFDDNSDIAHRRGLAIFRTNRHDKSYYFILERSHFNGNWPLSLFVSIVIVALVVGSAYFVVNRLLRPIQQLRQATRDVADGKFETSITTKRRDELGELVHTFNEMVTNIDNLIQTKDQLLLDVSHELRSPLTRMKVASEMLDENRIAASIHDDIELLEKLVTDILESARLRHELEESEKSDVDICALVEKIATQFESVSPGLTITNKDNSCITHGIETQLEIAIKNIIDNALKFSNSQQRPVELSIEKKPEYICLEIADYGIGISKDETERMFLPFTRLDRARSHTNQGFGLGLNIANTIVNNHHGKISVETNEGRTSFRIDLPIKNR